MKNKKSRIFIYAFFCFLVISFAMSKTIYYIYLTKVNIFIPTYDKLIKTNDTYGDATWSDVEEIFATKSGDIKSVYYKNGDYVKKGDLLYIISLDKKESIINNDSQKFELQSKKIDISIQELTLEKNSILSYIDNISVSNTTAVLKSTYELQIKQYENKLEIQKESFEKNNILYNNGIISLEELKKFESELQDTKDSIDNLKELKKIEDYNNLVSENNKKEDISLKIKEYKDQIELIELKIKALNVDKEILTLDKLNFQKNIPPNEPIEEKIYATTDGLITEIIVKKGQVISKGQLSASIALLNEYKIMCEIPEEIDFISIGQECKIEKGDKEYKGIVSEIVPKSDKTSVSVKMYSDKNINGQRFKVNFKQESEKEYILIVNSSINKDSKGFFVFKINKRKGIFSEEYYTSKSYVKLGDTDGINTIVIEGIDEIEPFVSNSSKVITSNTVVSIINEEDLLVH